MKRFEHAFGPLTKRAIGEEILGALHIIVALVLFAHGWTFLGWLFGARAIFDEIAAFCFAYAAVRREPGTLARPPS